MTSRILSEDEIHVPADVMNITQDYDNLDKVSGRGELPLVSTLFNLKIQKLAVINFGNYWMRN